MQIKKNTDLESTLILLCLFSYYLSVLPKDGRHTFKPLDGLCVELHVKR